MGGSTYWGPHTGFLSESTNLRVYTKLYTKNFLQLFSKQENWIMMKTYLNQQIPKVPLYNHPITSVWGSGEHTFKSKKWEKYICALNEEGIKMYMVNDKRKRKQTKRTGLMVLKLSSLGYVSRTGGVERGGIRRIEIWIINLTSKPHFFPSTREGDHV